MSKFNDQWLDSIYKWCNAKGIDPKKVFAANGWDKNEEAKIGQWSSGDMRIPLKMVTKNPINTSNFEEAQIIE